MAAASPNASTVPLFLLLLVLATALFGSARGGWNADNQKCASDDTLTLDEDMKTLSITPVNFTKNLQLSVTELAAGDLTHADKIYVRTYVLLDADSPCKGQVPGGKIDFGFSIQAASDPTKRCAFNYTWFVDDGLIQPTAGANRTIDYSGLTQVSFEVLRVDKNNYQTSFNDLSNVPIGVKDKAAACFDVAGNATNFLVQVDRPATSNARPDGIECGVQLELRGDYSVHWMKIDGTECAVAGCPNCTDANGRTTAAPQLTTGADDDDGGGGLPLWGIILIAVGALLLVLAVIGIPLVYFLVIKKKKKKAGAEEDGTHTAKELEPAVAATATEEESPASNDDASNAAAK